MSIVDATAGTDEIGRQRRARARERYGFAAGLAADTATSIEQLEEAVALLEGTGPSVDRAVLSGTAANLMLAGRASESMPFAEQAIEYAPRDRQAGDRVALPRGLGVDRANLGGIGGGIELLRRSLALATPTDDPTVCTPTPISAACSRWAASPSRRRSRYLLRGRGHQALQLEGSASGSSSDATRRRT